MRTMFSAIPLLALSVSFPAHASGLFAVSAELSHQGKVFAAPSAVVREGEPASVEASGADPYRLGFTVRELAANEIEVVATVDSPHGMMAPTVVVRPAVPASIDVGDIGLKLTVKRSGD